MRRTEIHASEARRITRLAIRSFGEAGTKDARKDAVRLFKQAAALGDAVAHEWLGCIYDEALIGRRNRPLAMKHFRIAADAGNVSAQYNLGGKYHELRKYKEAVCWLKRAAKANVPEAIDVLGHCYRYGNGVRKNQRKGFEMQLSAAKKGMIEAQFGVGFCYSRGEGVASDPKEALRWYLKAAKRGHADAAHNVAFYYEHARGVRKNRAKADFWYDRAESLRARKR